MITVNKTAELTGHGSPIFTLELSQKPDILFTGGNDKGLVEWSLKENAFIKVLFPAAASVYAIHCPEGYPFLFAGLRNGDILVFDFTSQKIVEILKAHQLPVFDIKSIKRKDELLVASEDGTVSVWSLKTLQKVYSVKVSDDTIRSIGISASEKHAAFGCRDNSIRIYDLEDYTLIKTIYGHTLPVFTVQFGPDDSYLVSGSRDAQLKIWDSLSFEMIKSIPAHMFAVNHIAFHPTLPYFATASMDKSIKIWGSDDFKLYRIISREKGYAGHQLSVNKLAWNGNKLISVSDDKRIIIWDIQFDAS
jgi:centriolar protein POC1